MKLTNHGKQHIRTFRLSQSEEEQLTQKAKVNGMTPSAYMRFLITQKPMDYPELRQDCKRLINEVNRIGKNINQIVYRHNANWYQKGDKESLIAYMKKLNETLEETIAAIGNY